MAAPAVAIRLPSAAPMMVPAVPKVDSRTAEVTAAKALAMTWIGLISSRAFDSFGSFDSSLTCPSLSGQPKRHLTAPCSCPRQLVWTGLDTRVS